MKTQIFTSSGKKGKEIELPRFFSAPVRKDILSKVLEAKKTIQPYGPSPMAGKQHAASGKIVHRRHVWRSGYGRGMSRVPRKITVTRGSQFNWEAAEIPFARGGRRAHPPKPASHINIKKINKKELNLAFISALSATANEKEIANKYQTIDENDLKNIPFIIESKITELKTKDFVKTLNKILGEKLSKVAFRNRNIRKGKGKLRGRKYKINAGALLVIGKNEKAKFNIIEIKNAENLSINDLARGGPGRIVIYTEKAIENLKEKFK